MNYKIVKFNLIFLFLILVSYHAMAENIELDTLRKQAQSGDVKAQLELGKEFFFGINRAKNVNLSFYYFNMAAKNGSEEGNFNVGICYDFGYGVPKSSIVAFEYYQKAPTLDEAKFKVAKYLQNGIRGEKVGTKYYKSIEEDKDKAQELINELVKRKYPPALTEKAKEILVGGTQDETTTKYAFDLLQEALKRGDVVAKKMLIDCYLQGIGVDKNEDEAKKLAQELYDSGDKELATKLGTFYEYGIGAPPDMQKAFEFYQIGANFGDGFAKIKVADQYLSGFLVPSDIEKAMNLYREEMKKNNPVALLRLGDAFANGIGVERDDYQAFLLYLKAAAMGEVEAQYKLANSFREGKGTRIDEGAVFFWLKQGASARNLTCIRELAICYLEGYGTPVDREIAKKLLIDAANANDKASQQILDEVF